MVLRGVQTDSVCLGRIAHLLLMLGTRAAVLQNLAFFAQRHEICRHYAVSIAVLAHNDHLVARPVTLTSAIADLLVLGRHGNVGRDGGLHVVRLRQHDKVLVCQLNVVVFRCTHDLCLLIRVPQLCQHVTVVPCLLLAYSLHTVLVCIDLILAD
jgi:hypothetical protein